MPREQRTSLNKTAVNEVPLGEFKSGVAGTVSMPVVQPKKSAGQALAEGLGVAAKGLATIGQTKIEENNKRNNISQSAKGTLAGRTEAYRLIAEAKKNEISLEMLGETYAKGIGAANDSLGSADNINPAYFSSYMGILGNTLANEQAGNEKLLLAKQTALDEKEMSAELAAQFDSGMDGATMYENLRNSHLHMTNADFGKFYIANIAAIIKEKHQSVPGFDAAKAIKHTLKIITQKDSVNFATHRDYGKTIDTLEKGIETLNSARATEAKRVETTKLNNWTNSSVLALMDKPTPETISRIYTELQHAATTGVSTEKFSKVQAALDAVLDLEGFGSVSNPETKTLWLSLAQQGNLNMDILSYAANKQQLTREDYFKVLQAQAKYDADYMDDTKKGYIEESKIARNAGLSLIVDGAAGNLFRGSTNAKTMGAAYQAQYGAWLAQYKADNSNNYPTSTESHAKAIELATTLISREEAFKAKELAQQAAVAKSQMDTKELQQVTQDEAARKADAGKTYTPKKATVEDLTKPLWAEGAATIENFEYLKPFFEESNGTKIKELIDNGIISRENAQQMKRAFRNY
jgi:hypothetical protein